MTTQKASGQAPNKPVRAPSAAVQPKGVATPKAAARSITRSVPAKAVAKPAIIPNLKPADKKAKNTGKETRVSLEFRLPKEEREALKALKLRVRKMEPSVKKSMLLRAAIKTLMSLPDADLLAAIKVVKVT